MEKLRTISARVNESLYSELKEAADEADMSISEWITDRITDGTDDSDSLTGEEILNMDWEEKIGVTDEYGLDVDPNEYEDDDDAFAEAICDELGLEFPLDDGNPGIPMWVAIIPIIGFIVWVISKAFEPKPEPGV